jgi:hypothetical protein
MFSLQTDCSTDGGQLAEPETPAKYDQMVAFIENSGESANCKLSHILYVFVHFTYWLNAHIYCDLVRSSHHVILITAACTWVGWTCRIVNLVFMIWNTVGIWSWFDAAVCLRHRYYIPNHSIVTKYCHDQKLLFKLMINMICILTQALHVSR